MAFFGCSDWTRTKSNNCRLLITCPVPNTSTSGYLIIVWSCNRICLMFPAYKKFHMTCHVSACIFSISRQGADIGSAPWSIIMLLGLSISVAVYPLTLTLHSSSFITYFTQFNCHCSILRAMTYPLLSPSLLIQLLHWWASPCHLMNLRPQRATRCYVDMICK